MYFQPQDNVGHICMYTVHHELATSIFPLLGNATTVCVCVFVCVCVCVRSCLCMRACVCVGGWVGVCSTRCKRCMHTHTHILPHTLILEARCAVCTCICEYTYNTTQTGHLRCHCTTKPYALGSIDAHSHRIAGRTR